MSLKKNVGVRLMVGEVGRGRGVGCLLRSTHSRHAFVDDGRLSSFGDWSWASRVLWDHRVEGDDGIGVVMREVVRVAKVMVEHIADDAENRDHEECDHCDCDGKEGEG